MRFRKYCAALLAVMTAAACTGCGLTDTFPQDGTTAATTAATAASAVNTVTETTVSAVQTVTSAKTAVGLVSSASTAGTTETVVQSTATTAAATENGGNQNQQNEQPVNTTKAQAVQTQRQTAVPATTVSTAETEAVTETTAAPKPVEALPGIDADLVERVSKMNLHEKVSQMMMASASDAETAKTAIKSGVGAMALFAKAFSGKSKKQVQQMTDEFQKAAKIPILISIDEEGGTVNRVSINKQLRATPFWSPSALYEQGGWDLVISDTQEKADLLLSLGVNSNLGPVCDVALTKNDYIFNRTFSLDYNMTAQYAETVVKEMKKKGLGSTLKHFPGYGGSRDTHKNMATDNREYSAFETGDFLPFQAGIAAGADSVMVSHNIVTCMDKDLPASLSPAVHKILRETLGFTGVIITDDLGMNAITQFTNGKNPAVAAVLAGNDFLCYADYQNSVPAIEKAVKSGEISEEQINASVQRILQWKRNIGLI